MKIIIAVLALVIVGAGVFFVVRPDVQKTQISQASAVSPDSPASSKIAVQDSKDNGWVSRCQDLKEGEKVTGKHCEAFQQLFITQKDADPSTAQRVIEMAIGYPPNNPKEAQAVIILPLGVMVNEKSSLEVDGDKMMNFEVLYCEAGGCIASFVIKDGDIEKLRKGRELTVKSKAATGQPLLIGLTLNNFATVMDSLQPKG